MPRLDERFAMAPYRYGYIKTRDGVARLDWQTMQLAVHRFADPADSAQEPVFVPRYADSPEGDGYLLFVVNRGSENRADLVILDAMNIEGPAVATVKLPFNQPGAFHGMFVARG